MKIKARGRYGVAQINLSHENLRILRSMPGQFKWEGSSIVFEPSAPNLDYLREKYPLAEWSEEALKFCKIADNMRANTVKAPARRSEDYLYKIQPFEHQKKVFLSSRDKSAFALLMEQGTGKTKVILDTAAWLFAKGEITGLLVIAKNGVHRNWVDNEIPDHLPDHCNGRSAFWSSKKGEKGIKHLYAASTKPCLTILTINIEALSTKRGEKICEEFLLTYPSITVVDESTCIKTPGAKRTKAVLRLANYSRYRRILTGTPITKGPLDAYSQFQFLDEAILGFGSFYTFKAHFAVQKPLPGKMFRGRPIQIVVGYQNLPELQTLIAPHSYRVLKSECLDLPPKLYQRERFSISEEQWKHYEAMRDEIMTEFEGRRIAAPLAMTRLMRLHQIACGFLPPPEDSDEPGVAINKEGKNPRLEALLDLLDNIEGKVIIYATYRFNLREIWQALTAKYGRESCVAYAGNVKSDDRAAAVKSFQDPESKVRFFIGQTEAAGYGLTLTQARTVIYYSNDYKLETRLQSEDRAHRIGQTGTVLYIDLQADETVDEDIIDSLLEKFDVASQITGDKLISWLADNS